MNRISRPATWIIAAALAVGTLSVACSSEPAASPSEATPRKVRTAFRASRATIDAIGVVRWELLDTVDGFATRGVDIHGAERALLAVKEGRAVTGELVRARVRMTYRDETVDVSIEQGMRSAEQPLSSAMTTALTRALSDARATTTAASAKPGNVTTKDYWDDCYECAGPPSSPSPSSSSDNGGYVPSSSSDNGGYVPSSSSDYGGGGGYAAATATSSQSAACSLAVLALYVATAQALLLCAIPEPIEPLACGFAVSRVAIAEAARRAACTPQPQSCMATWQCTGRYGAGWSCSGGACVSSGLVTPGKCKVNRDCKKGEVCGLDQFCRAIVGGGGGGGGGGSSSSSGGIGCTNDWDCNPIESCIKNSCGSG